MSAFNASDWISCGKHWNSVPPVVHQAAKHVFTTPESLCERLFRWLNINLHGLINIYIPTSFHKQATIQSQEDFLSCYFSADLSNEETPMSLTTEALKVA